MTAAQAAHPATVAVVPMFNEQATIRDVVDDLLPRVDAVVVVDDGSTDASLAALDGAPVHVLRSAVNRGKSEALRRGLGVALELGASAVITLDADGQHPPRYIPALLAAHSAAPHAVVIAARQDPAASAPRVRRFANRAADFFISWAAGVRLRDTQSGFRLYPARLAQRLCSLHGEGFVFESEALMAAIERGYQARYVCIPALYCDLARPSHYRPLRDTARIARGVSVRLLRAGMSPARLARSQRSEAFPSV